MGSLPRSSWYFPRFKPTSFSWEDMVFQMSEPLLHKQSAHQNQDDISFFLLRPWNTHPTGLGPSKEDAKSYFWSLKDKFFFYALFLLISLSWYFIYNLFSWSPFHSSLGTQLKCHFIKPLWWTTFSSSPSTFADAPNGGLRGQGGALFNFFMFPEIKRILCT